MDGTTTPSVPHDTTSTIRQLSHSPHALSACTTSWTVYLSCSLSSAMALPGTCVDFTLSVGVVWSLPRLGDITNNRSLMYDDDDDLDDGYWGGSEVYRDSEDWTHGRIPTLGFITLNEYYESTSPK